MKKIIINNSQWQTRIAITEDDDLINIYFDQHTHETLERSFFKGKVNKVLPGIQTAFVDIGQERAGFLHISEIDREMALHKIIKQSQIDDEDIIPKEKGPRQKPDIGKILKDGDDVLVQVSKEPVYEKGPKLTTCFTLPGRFFVLMPNIPRFGVSKKIENRDERNRLKDLVKQNVPEGMGAIIRTSAEEADQKELLKDLHYLVSIWNAIEKKYATAQSQEKIHEDLDIVLQIVRDHLDEQVDAIIVDNEKIQSSIYKFVRNTAPEYSHIIKLYTGSVDIFEQYKIEQQIQDALERKIHLKSGGSLIIETTEAMTVVDVNTGKFIGKTNLEDTILKTNLEAAEEIARQLRLRNIGGLIVIDFIDMVTSANRQKLFRFFEKILKERDKFQSVVLKVSEFGIVQMTRKRSGKTLMQQLMQACSLCNSLGFVKSMQTRAYELFRLLKKELSNPLYGKNVIVGVAPTVFDYITSIEYDAILTLEKTYGSKITLESNQTVKLNDYKISKL